ncbi:MAG: endonuclease VII domain-containing protein [Nitrososphaeraceae archaeon]
MPKGIYKRTLDNIRKRTNFTHCKTCGTELNDTNSVYMQDYLRSNCKECHNEDIKERNNRPNSYTKTPEYKLKYKHWNLQRKFGISLEDYNKLLKIQGNTCAICKEPCSSGKNLAVDHNHITGEVRGLLCEKCNQGIGALRENPELIMSAYEYLERTTWGYSEKMIRISPAATRIYEMQHD